MKDHASPLLDLSGAAPDIISMVIGSMPLRERFNCALVCKAWAEAATAATHSINLQHGINDLSSLQHWLQKHGNALEVLQLHACYAVVTALPCCAQLQDLLLHSTWGHDVSIDSKTWCDIATATKLTSLSLSHVWAASQQADVVAALTALPNLEQLTWCAVRCSDNDQLSDSLLLQCMTLLTSLDLHGLTAAALQHLGSLTKLQHLSISDAEGWIAPGCPGLQELKALTSLKLSSRWPLRNMEDLPASASQLTALRQLDVQTATPTALNQLQVLTGLTQLRVQYLRVAPEPVPLQLPCLQHLELQALFGSSPMSLVASCTQLQFLKLQRFNLKGAGSLVASTMLQHLELDGCKITAADGAADAASWQQVFPGPGQLPHLTSLQLLREQPALQQTDIEALVVCCSNLRVLGFHRLRSSCAPPLARLPGLTSLSLHALYDELCSAMVQLTGLRQLTVHHPRELTAVGLRQLAALDQLTTLCFERGVLGCSQLDTLVKQWMKDKSDTLPRYGYATINKVCEQLVLSDGVGVRCNAMLPH